MSLLAAGPRFVGVSIFGLLVCFFPAIGGAQTTCGPLPAPSGTVIDVTPQQAGSLWSIVQSAGTGTTIRLADGVYPLTHTVVFANAGVTLRSQSGDPARVVLDGAYGIGDVLLIQESNVTIADVSVTRAYNHPVHVAPVTHSTGGTLLHNLRIIDGAEQFIKINPQNGFYADNGIVRCSSLELTDAGRIRVRNNCYTGGVDGHQARGWQVSANVFNGFWCSSGLSEHAIHFWTGSRDTIVDRNVIINSARGVGFGMGENWPGRTYSDQPCSGKAAVGHFGGSITNTVIFANDSRLFASDARFDAGITLEQSCETNVLHNTVVSTNAPFSSIEWRFANTVAVIANNLVSHNLRARDGATATLAGNIVNAPSSLFVDAVDTGDLHLRSTATDAIDRAAPLANPVRWDIDAAPRETAADVGADEFVGSDVFIVTATSPVVAGSMIDVSWSALRGRATSDDWIGLFAAGAADSAVLDQMRTEGQLSGTVPFIAPGTAGLYEFRYFNDAPPVRVAVSNPVSVTAPIPPPPLPGDTAPPSVTITSPTNGETVRRHIDVAVQATDNVSVIKVELYVDGTLRAESSTAPFTIKWNANSVRPGAHTLQAKASDAAGNTGASPIVTVTR